MQEEKRSFLSNFSLWNIIKFIFVLSLLANIVPMVINNIKDKYMVKTGSTIPTYVIDIGCDCSKNLDSGVIDSSQPYVRQIRKAAENDDVKAIVLKINSPGGSPGACELILRQILLAKEKKPVLAIVENTCASGGYWIASACNKIVCPETALVGSVGAIMQTFNFKGLANRFDVNVKTIKAGKYKAIGNPWGDPMTDDEFKYLNNFGQEVYKVFAESVAKNRALSIANIAEWADGKIFTGKKALELGLVDQIGGVGELEEHIKKLTELDGEIVYLRAPKPSTLAKFLNFADDDGLNACSCGHFSIRGLFKEFFTQASECFCRQSQDKILLK